MHEWPRIKTFGLPEHMEDWELHGIREWAYRFDTQTPLETATLPIAWYLGHRMLNPIADAFQRPLWLSQADTRVYRKGTQLLPGFDLGSGFCSTSSFVALKGEKKYPLVTTYADGLSYWMDESPQNQMLVFDGSRILHGRDGAFQGERAIVLVTRYTDRAWQVSGDESRQKRNELIQQGAEIIHQMFETPYNAKMEGTAAIREFLLQKALPELKSYAPLQEAVVSEKSIVDPRLRKTQVSFIPFQKYPEIAAHLQAALKTTMPGVAPQYDGPEDLNEPALQYTVYQPGAFYDWHKDGSFDGFKKRRVSITMLLQEAAEGGILELEHVGAIPLRPGDVAVFPSYKRHRVTEVTKGERHSLVGWFEEREEQDSPASLAETEEAG